ncbi:hypothetical protein SERLA73DRAFT_158743 [Serpula lacrymans var. lacrymans S7.3]|uniref:UNC-45/Cro1/She4 central domain-containing protein n=2 Tax=Serpula lacrymans var. lacrymans TaxID=341189 RepID=F8PPJ7_SERL3|nr:uncharacterized protein SERLADRAFT_413610 [Serpula lacrymans var. lacrymans S7.9]EGO01416.1 hypothetical protein SERLA73DRAFT_158743 [Serpula lacrymans var. lacrymans S7.3]EGO27048.1 hypothetical protein SERLADRAFT_413610 [Serpula lacrymans var. lacrymans S7.9]
MSRNMSSKEHDAMKLLAKVADAFDNPLAKEFYKTIRLNSIATHQPQTNRSEPNKFVHPARLRLRDSLIDFSHAFDELDIMNLTDVSFLSQWTSTSEISVCFPRNLGIDEQGDVSEDDLDEEYTSSEELMKALSTGSPLDRLIQLARVELKQSGWFERSDKWLILDSGLSGPVTPVSKSLSTPPTPFKSMVFLPTPRSSSGSYLMPVSAFGSTIPNCKYDEPGVFDGDFLDVSSLLYDKPLPSIQEPARKPFGRVKKFVKKVIASSGANTAVATAKIRHSMLLRTPPGPTAASQSSGSWTAAGWTTLSSQHSQTHSPTPSPSFILMDPTTASNAPDPILNSVLEKSRTAAAFDSVLPDELSYLVTAFSPSQTPALRSKAYLVLAAFCQGVRTSSSENAGKNQEGSHDLATKSLTEVFHPHIVAYFTKYQESDILDVVSFLTALFQVDWQSASSLFQMEGFVDFVTDALDLCSSPQVFLEVAHLLGQASGYKPCRAVIPSELTQWLESKSRQTKDSALRAAASVSLVKMSHGSAADTAAVSTGTTNVSQLAANDEELAKTLKGMVISGISSSSQNDTIEGLAYLSVNPVVKESLAYDSVFLTKLFSLFPRRQPSSDSTSLYGILVIISNLCAYKPQLSEEQAQMEKLKRMTKPGEKSAKVGAHDALEDDARVKARAKSLVAQGALGVLAIASRMESQGVRVTAGKAYLSLAQDQENRGKIMQSGGAKALISLIRHSLASSHSSQPNASSLDVNDLNAIQALAKLAITASPFQVFGPNEGAIYDAVRPFCQLLLHDSSTLLQQFEVMMALTNISSYTAECAARVGKADGLLNKVEAFILSDHTLVRRAAVELICNLIAGSEEVFEKYGGKQSKAAQSKLQLLVAMSDVEDMPTRLAASGALATVTSAPSACHALFELQMDRHRVFPILARLIDPSLILENESDEESDEEIESESSPGLVHRGMICIRNVLLNSKDSFSREMIVSESETAALKLVVAKILKGEVGPPDTTITKVAIEVLQFLTVNNK